MLLNHDPEVFERPDEFVLDRANSNAHFGVWKVGRHMRADTPLARLRFWACPGVSSLDSTNVHGVGRAIRTALKVILKSTSDSEVS